MPIFLANQNIMSPHTNFYICLFPSHIFSGLKLVNSQSGTFKFFLRISAHCKKRLREKIMSLGSNESFLDFKRQKITDTEHINHPRKTHILRQQRTSQPEFTSCMNKLKTEYILSTGFLVWFYIYQFIFSVFYTYFQ